ncbi:hypothetical protein N5P37_004902, partial [Trichoderma harzianum]
VVSTRRPCLNFHAVGTVPYHSQPSRRRSNGLLVLGHDKPARMGNYTDVVREATVLFVAVTEEDAWPWDMQFRDHAYSPQTVAEAWLSWLMATHGTHGTADAIVPTLETSPVSQGCFWLRLRAQLGTSRIVAPQVQLRHITKCGVPTWGVGEMTAD